MKAKLLSILISVVISSYLTFCVESLGRQAFDSNINACLFESWTNRTNPVLSKPVNCSSDARSGLCYGVNQKAFFAVCYNNKTLIPDFSGHIVQPICGKRARGRGKWRNEAGKHAPNRQSHVSKDYRSQASKEAKRKNRFYSRGHLTPNADFLTRNGRKLTMVNTNIAPQWQLFNGGNWANLENAVRKYSDKERKQVFVFTGTGGTVNNSVQKPILLNNRVVVPKYFWKAICDPMNNRSVVFLAENPTGVEGSTKKDGCDVNGRNGRLQTASYGVIYCYSLNALQQDKHFSKLFNLPSFADSCGPGVRGRFLDDFLNSTLV